MFDSHELAKINRWSTILFIIAVGSLFIEFHTIIKGQVAELIPINTLAVLCLIWSIKRFVSRTAAVVLFLGSAFDAGEILSQMLGIPWFFREVGLSDISQELQIASAFLLVGTAIGSLALVRFTWIYHRERESTVVVNHLAKRVTVVAVLLLLFFFLMVFLGPLFDGYENANRYRASIFGLLILAGVFLPCWGLMPVYKNQPITLPKNEAIELSPFTLKRQEYETTTRLFAHQRTDGKPVIRIGLFSYYTFDEIDFERLREWDQNLIRKTFRKNLLAIIPAIACVFVLTSFLWAMDFDWPVLLLPGSIILIGYFVFVIKYVRPASFAEFEKTFPNAQRCKKSDIFHKRSMIENLSAIIWSKRKNAWILGCASVFCVLESILLFVFSETAVANHLAIGWVFQWPFQLAFAISGVVLAVLFLRTWQIKYHFFKLNCLELTPENLIKVRDSPHSEAEANG